GAGGVVGERGPDREAAFVVGVAARDREDAAAQGADRTGGGGAVAPLDRGREVAGQVAWIGDVGEGRHRAADCGVLGARDGGARGYQHIVLGTDGRAGSRGAGGA